MVKHPMDKNRQEKDLVINDPIHKSVVLSAEEREIIDHKYFQRLRRIKALGFLDRVFPSAQHTRFEHSLGACHVVGLIFDSMKDNSKIIGIGKGWSPESEYFGLDTVKIDEVFSESNREAVRIAALLHDLGHGPYSHVSERLMPNLELVIKANRKKVDSFIIDGLERKLEELRKKRKSRADHEDYSIILQNMLLIDAGFAMERRRLIASIKSKYVSPSGDVDMQFISAFRGLIDGELDCDRMDYLLRDSYFCGVPYGNYDIDKIVRGLCLVTNKDGELRVGILRKSLSALEHFIFSRFQMHVQIYTHKTEASVNEAFIRLIKDVNDKYTLPKNAEKFSELDDACFMYCADDIKKKNSALKMLLNERILWKLCFESYNQDESIDSVIMQKYKSKMGDDSIVKYTSQRPIKKVSLFDLPVIGKDLIGRPISNRLSSISQLVNHYNGVFNVKRLYIPKDQRKTVDQILGDLSGDRIKAAKAVKSQTQKFRRSAEKKSKEDKIKKA